jgi:hypothetical protein
MTEYLARRDGLATTEKAEMLLIEVPIDSQLSGDAAHATAEDRTKARLKARELLDRAREELESGVEFSAVARAYSQGLGKAQGGAIGEISPGALTKRWEKPAEALFALEEGRLSSVIETDEALFLVMCGKKTPAHIPTFEEAQQQLSEELLDADYNRLRAEYITRLMEKATVSRKMEFFHAVLSASPLPPNYRTTGLASDGNR